MPVDKTTKHILLFGAGKSATVLIEYLKNLSAKEGYKVTIADNNLQAVQQKTRVLERRWCLAEHECNVVVADNLFDLHNLLHDFDSLREDEVDVARCALVVVSE